MEPDDRLRDGLSIRGHASAFHRSGSHQDAAEVFAAGGLDAGGGEAIARCANDVVAALSNDDLEVPLRIALRRRNRLDCGGALQLLEPDRARCDAEQLDASGRDRFSIGTHERAGDVAAEVHSREENHREQGTFHVDFLQ